MAEDIDWSAKYTANWYHERDYKALAAILIRHYAVYREAYIPFNDMLGYFFMLHPQQARFLYDMRVRHKAAELAPKLPAWPDPPHATQPTWLSEQREIREKWMEGGVER